MTDRPTNRLLSAPLGSSRPAFIDVRGETVPTDLDQYCAWLNAKDRRPGKWVVVTKDGVRQIDRWESNATDGWVAEKGLLPKIGRAA